MSSLLLASVSTRAASPERIDFQQWNELDVTLPVTKDIELTWMSQARLSSDRDGPVTYASGLSMDTAIGNVLTLSPFYSHYNVYDRVNGRWPGTGELGADLVLAGGSERCLLSDRSRNYHVRGGPTDLWVYRNRPRIDCRMTSLPLTLYVSDELFHYSTLGGWTRNRFASGAHWIFGHHAALDVYYLRQDDQRQIPGVINGLGLTLELNVN